MFPGIKLASNGCLQSIDSPLSHIEKKHSLLEKPGFYKYLIQKKEEEELAFSLAKTCYSDYSKMGFAASSSFCACVSVCAAGGCVSVSVWFCPCVSAGMSPLTTT